SNVTDISIADFNGDLRPDIFVARGRTQDSDVAQFNDSAIHCSALTRVNRPACEGTFHAGGTLNVSLLTANNQPFQVHIGSDSTVQNVIGTVLSPFQSWDLPTDSAFTAGFQDPTLPTGIHCVFGRLEGDLWKFKIFNNSTNGTTVIMELNSSSPITDFNASGPPPPGEETRD